jgi:hypothetical protein
MLTRQEEEDLLRLLQLQKLAKSELQTELAEKIAKCEEGKDAYAGKKAP